MACKIYTYVSCAFRIVDQNSSFASIFPSLLIVVFALANRTIVVMEKAQRNQVAILHQRVNVTGCYANNLLSEEYICTRRYGLSSFISRTNDLFFRNLRVRCNH